MKNDLLEVAKPLMDYLKNLHPHHKAIVDSEHVEILEGIKTANYAIPKRKQIDWKKMLGNVVEFSSDGEKWFLGKLKSIVWNGMENGPPDHYRDEFLNSYEYCRPAHNILFGYDGGKCPLPEGIRVQVYYRGEDAKGSIYAGDVSSYFWEHHFSSSDIVSYEIIGISEGYEL